MTPDLVQYLIELLTSIKNSQGVTLLKIPPQTAWEANGLDHKVSNMIIRLKNYLQNMQNSEGNLTDDIIKSFPDGSFKDVLVLGVTPNGEVLSRNSFGSPEEELLLIEMYKKELLNRCIVYYPFVN
jgi:hypothetical protein